MELGRGQGMGEGLAHARDNAIHLGMATARKHDCSIGRYN